MASFALASCADQPEPIQDMSNIVEMETKPQANLAVLKRKAPKVKPGVKSKVPTLSMATEGTDEPPAQTLPPAVVSGKNSSLSPIPDISKLIGLNRIGLNSLLGKPVLVRREAEAEVWQYIAANCVLHLFLYRDAINDFPYRVVHIEANRINTVRASIYLNSFERKKLMKLCYSRLFNQAKSLENRG